MQKNVQKTMNDFWNVWPSLRGLFELSEQSQIGACACVDDALSRCELARTELEMEMSKVRMEAAGLRDALVKMQNVNEGLAQDKADLSKTLMQVAI